jgi:hypothetical protein
MWLPAQGLDEVAGARELAHAGERRAEAGQHVGVAAGGGRHAMPFGEAHGLSR